MKARYDLIYAAYAVSVGFSLKLNPGDSFVAGLPRDYLSFERKGFHIFGTARGWRVAFLCPTEGKFSKARDADFHTHLFDALEDAFNRSEPVTPN